MLAFNLEHDDQYWYLDNRATVHVIGTKSNLHSIDRGCAMIFTSSGCWIMTNSKPTTIVSEGVRNSATWLYRLSVLSKPTAPPQLTPPQLEANLTEQGNTILLHRRLRHINFHTFYNLSMATHVKGIPYISLIKPFCHECIQGKSTKAIAPKESTTRALNKHYLLHTDLCGPCSQTSQSNSRYFFTIIADYRRMTWVFFLKNKSSTFTKFKGFHAYIEGEGQH